MANSINLTSGNIKEPQDSKHQTCTGTVWSVSKMSTKTPRLTQPGHPSISRQDDSWLLLVLTRLSCNSRHDGWHSDSVGQSLITKLANWLIWAVCQLNWFKLSHADSLKTVASFQKNHWGSQ